VIGPTQKPLQGLNRASASGFGRLAKAVSRFTASQSSFGLAIACIAAWLLLGPVFAFSDTWQLVVNTGTTVVTFLMVFLIQNTQARDAEAMQIKLDELIRVTEAASNALLDLEELDESSLDRYRTRYLELARECRKTAAPPSAEREPAPRDLMAMPASSGKHGAET
jgi:low affinity Fe/Cu permease